MPKRPRDRLGRPLPADADPSLVAEPVVDISGLLDVDVWAIALGYLQRGLPFHAHETFESRWRTCSTADRAAWRGLAQWGAALTHAARGNTEGADRLARRATETITAADHLPSCIDVTHVLASCASLMRPVSP